MKKSLLPVALAGAALILGACQQDNKDVIKKLDEISKKLDKIQATGVGGAAPQAQRPAQRPGPDPTKTYGFPVDDLPAIGNPNALITVVKNYEYACPFCEKVRPTEDQLFKDYGLTEVYDIVGLSAGVSSTQRAATGNLESYTIRGFTTFFSARNGNTNFRSFDSANVARLTETDTRKT